MSGTALRILTGAILIPLVVVLVFWAPLYVVTAFAAAATVLALWEFFGIAAHIGIHAYRCWTIAAGIAIFVQEWDAPRANVGFIFLVFLLGIAALVLFGKRAVAEIFGNVSASAAGLIFVALPLSAVVRLAAIPTVGRELLLFTLVIVWVGDTAAYFVGRSFGRAKLAPQWSPNKTWEGAVANLIGAVLVAVIFARWIRIPITQLLILAALASIAGQAGDIFESALKRSAGVKDSGAILPGHGGMYDRIDALIFAAPVVWYYFAWVVRSIN